MTRRGHLGPFVRSRMRLLLLTVLKAAGTLAGTMDRPDRKTDDHPLPLVLASASPRRRELLERTGVPFTVVPSEAEEAPHEPGATPESTCLLNAGRKVEAVAAGLSYRAIVLGADTIVVVGGLVLGKPVDGIDACRMLSLLSGRSHRVMTGCVLMDTGTGEKVSFVTTTEVVFKTLEVDEVVGYVATGEPLDKAGGYGIQARGAFLVSRVNGSYTNVVGLPLAEVLDALAELGGPRPFGTEDFLAEP